MSQHIVDHAGRSLSGTPQSRARAGRPNGRGGVLNCLSPRIPAGRRYQPASHYWQFQWTEAALFLVLAAALVTYALVHTLRSRTA